MKQTRLTKAVAGGAGCLLAIATVVAQETTTTTTRDSATGTTTTESTTTTSAGTITAYIPGSDYITFRSTTDASPMRYYYTKSTTVLDPEGRVVTWSAVRPDVPATVYYTREGDRMIVTKVVLSKPALIEKKETTTTTTTTTP